MRLFCLLVLLMMCARQSLAQKRAYDSLAVWFPEEGATEKFAYLEADSTMKPDGEYNWRLTREIEEGKYELVSLKAHFKDGLPHGELDLLIYRLTFAIEGFTHKGVSAKTIGEKLVIKGRYEKAKPVGVWHFQQGPYEDAVLSAGLSFHVVSNTWSFQNETALIKGKTNQDGLFEGSWDWKLSDGNTLTANYENGTLVALQENNRPIFESIFSILRKQSGNADSIVAASELPNLTNQWIWQGSLNEQDPIALKQAVIAEQMKEILKPFYEAEKWIGAHPLLSLPALKGTSRWYYRVKPAEQKLLSEIDKRVEASNELLSGKIESPVFILRRPGNQELDNLMKECATLIGDLNQLRWRGVEFLQEQSRYIMPFYLEPFGSSRNKTTGDYLSGLDQLAIGLKVKADSLIYKSDELSDRLREQGAIEELENEWTYLVNDIRENYAPESANSFENGIFERFVISGFESRTITYANLKTQQERKQFLLHQVGLFQFYHSFFKEKRYNLVTDVNDDFVKSYTHYLYNPYMGVNNVEVVVRKRFLGKVLNEFWPYLTEELKRIPEAENFESRFMQIMDLRSTIIQVGVDKSLESRRLEKRVNKEKNPKAIEKHFMEYIQESKLKAQID